MTSESTDNRRVTFSTSTGSVEIVETGHDYEIVWRIDGVQRRDRISRMGFIGTNRASGALQFSARGPDRATGGEYAGTQEIEPKWIRTIREVPADHSRRFYGRIV